MLDQDKYDKHLRFTKWDSKLNKLDYHRSTRSFYAVLRGKNRNIEYFGPISDQFGKLSRTLEECLKNWSAYCKDR